MITKGEDRRERNKEDRKGEQRGEGKGRDMKEERGREGRGKGIEKGEWEKRKEGLAPLFYTCLLPALQWTTNIKTTLDVLESVVTLDVPGFLAGILRSRDFHKLKEPNCTQNGDPG